jgi:hypothetical protein
VYAYDNNHVSTGLATWQLADRIVNYVGVTVSLSRQTYLDLFQTIDKNKDTKITAADFRKTVSEDGGINVIPATHEQWEKEDNPNVKGSALKDNCGDKRQCLGFKCVHEVNYEPIPGFDIGIKFFRTTIHIQKCVEDDNVVTGQVVAQVAQSQILKELSSAALEKAGKALQIARRLPKSPLTAIVLDSLQPPTCELLADTKADGFCCVGYQATMAETVSENLEGKTSDFKRLPATKELCINVAQTAKDALKAEASSCFPAGSQVVTPTGLQRMDQLAVGDLVLTSAGFKPVMYFGHADPLVSTTFYNLRTSAGMVIKATPLHDIILHDPHRHTAVVKNAKSVQPGDLVWVYVNSSYRFADSIDMVYISTETGIFTPRTETNDVVVDWVLASCDTSDMRSISTVLHGFMRSMYFLFPSVFTIMDNFARSPSQLKTTEGMTFWLPQQMVLPFFKSGFFGYL